MKNANQPLLDEEENFYNAYKELRKKHLNYSAQVIKS